MFTKSKVALAFAVALGVSAPLASAMADGAVKDLGGVVVRPSPNVTQNSPAANSQNARGSYAQAHLQVRPSPNVPDVDARSRAQATDTRQPTSFEKNWFEYQSHDDQ
jgi:hypothetical protein